MLYLHGLGHFFPENIITNRFIQELDIGSDETWIMERVGISTRHTSLSLDYIKTTKNRDPRAAAEASIMTRSEIGAAAARMAIERAGLKPDDIGMVIHGTSTPDFIIPAEATLVAAELGIEAPCFDLNSACSTFVIQLSFLSGMHPDATPQFILIVNPENYTHVLDYSDKRSAPLFGDGCSAAVISAKVPCKKRFEGFYFDSAPSSWDKVRIPRTGHFTQDGRAVQGFAIRKSTASVQMLQKEFDVAPAHLKFVGHQANFMMLTHVAKRCDIKKDNHWYNVVDYGNTGCAGAPSVLSQNWEAQSDGDHIALAVVGSGLTWAHTMLIVGDA